MERNFETVMIEQCAPVLASLKPAGLFRYETRDCADLARRVKNWNTQLNPKGLRVRVLKGCVLNHRYLVYVYRESKLAAVLADKKVQSFLRQEGYRLPEAGEAPDVGNMLTQLSRKLCCSAEFPHEIGVFLGYPLGEPLQGKLAPHGQLAGIAVQFRGYDQRGQAGGVRVVQHGPLYQHGAVGGGSAAHQLDLAHIGKGRGPLQAASAVHHAYALPVLVHIQA